MEIMNYLQFGKGKDIVFLHGWGGSIASFLGCAKRLALKNRVTLVDFAGFGQTPEPKKPMSVSDYARDVIELMNKLSIASASFVGHSFGGRVAIEIASKHQILVEKLVLVSSAGIKPKRSILYYAKVFYHKMCKFFGLKGLAGSSDYQVLSPVMKESFKKIVNYNQRSQLSQIKSETAIFWGKSDKETKPYMAKIFKQNIANSELFWLRGGHFAYIDDFQKFVLILDAFLNGNKLGDNR